MSSTRSNEAHFHLVKDPTAQVDPRAQAIKEPHGGFIACVCVWGCACLRGVTAGRSVVSDPPHPHTNDQNSFDAHGHLTVKKGLSETENPSGLPYFLIEVRFVEFCWPVSTFYPNALSHACPSHLHTRGPTKQEQGHTAHKCQHHGHHH